MEERGGNSINIALVSPQWLTSKGVVADERRYAIAVQQIVQNNVRASARSLDALAGDPLPTIGSSRPQNDEPDPSIQELFNRLNRLAAELRRRLA